MGIEVKATDRLRAENFKGLRALKEENKMKKLIMVSQDKIERKIDGIECYYWENFLDALWSGKII